MTDTTDESLGGLISQALNFAYNKQPQDVIDAVDAAWAKLQPEAGRKLGEGYCMSQIRPVLVARWTLRIPARIELLRREYDNTHERLTNDGSGSLSPGAEADIRRELDSIDAGIVNLQKALLGWFESGCND